MHLDFLKKAGFHPGNLFRRRLYNRLMLYNTLIFVAVGYVLAFIASNAATELERVKQLQQNKDALLTVCSYYDRKQDEFLDLLFPMYAEQENYDALSRLLESGTDQPYESDPYAKQEITSVMRSITIRDSDIAGILLYKTLTGARYAYDIQNGILEAVGENYPFFKDLQDKAPGRQIFGSRKVGTGTYAKTVFGIGGTLGTRNIRLSAAHFIITYNTRCLEDILQRYGEETQGWFMVLSSEGDIIFDSRGQYDGEPCPYLDVLLSEKKTAQIDGQSCYIQTVQAKSRANRHYLAAHIVPRAEIDRQISHDPVHIFLLFTAMVVICAALYLIAGSLVSKRVGELKKAMKRVGSNNLSYRIPLQGRYDEFEEIAERFNEMCDELQDTINREYVSELRKRNAEFKALQTGINPHFLYNTLEAIRVKAFDEGNGDVAEMIVLLANLYRSIVKDRTIIPIRREIAMCTMYMNIFSLRYAGSFEYEMDIEPRLLDYGIPKNLLQPIIENYFVHGLRTDSGSNRFSVHGWLQEGDILFTFDDNGRGIGRERLEEIQDRLRTAVEKKGASYGLPNVNERIGLVYGEPYGLWISSHENSRTQITLRIKAMTSDELNESIAGSEPDKQSGE